MSDAVYGGEGANDIAYAGALKVFNQVGYN